MPRILPLLALVALVGCTEFPSLGDQVSEESLNADYPKLIALSQDGFAEDSTTGSDVIAELDNRSAGLWARIGSLFN